MITYHGSVEPPPHLGHRDLQESSDNLHGSHRPLPRCFFFIFQRRLANGNANLASSLTKTNLGTPISPVVIPSSKHAWEISVEIISFFIYLAPFHHVIVIVTVHLPLFSWISAPT